MERVETQLGAVAAMSKVDSAPPAAVAALMVMGATAGAVETPCVPRVVTRSGLWKNWRVMRKRNATSGAKSVLRMRVRRWTLMSPTMRIQVRMQKLRRWLPRRSTTPKEGLEKVSRRHPLQFL